MVNYDSPVPAYMQVANLLAADIESGKLAPGARVPSINRLVQEYGIAKNTARRALNELKERGLVVIAVGLGTFVTER